MNKQDNHQNEDDKLMQAFFNQAYAHEHSSYKHVMQPARPEAKRQHTNQWHPYRLVAAVAVLIIITAGGIWLAQKQSPQNQTVTPLTLEKPQEVMPLTPITTPLSEWQATTDYLLKPI